MHSPSNTDIEILAANDDTKALVPADPPILLRYDAACKAVAEAKRADEVLHIRDQARAMRAAAKIAKNRDIEIDAAEIRIRAERRLGELIKAQKETVGLATGGQPYQSFTGSKGAPVERPATLADAGIDKKLSSRAQQYADIPEDQWETDLANWRVEQQEGLAVSLFKPKKARPPKPAPLVDDVAGENLRRQRDPAPNGFQCHNRPDRQQGVREGCRHYSKLAG